jgi:hypothetical protein
LARDKADAAITTEAKNEHLSAEARWLGLARSYGLQDRLAKSLGGRKASRGSSPGYALVVAILTTAFRAIFAELDDRDEIVGVRAARRIIEMAARGERDPERFKAIVLAWVQDAHL